MEWEYRDYVYKLPPRSGTAKELVTMSTREPDRLEIARRIEERRLTQAKAGQLLGLSARQVRRLCARFADPRRAPGRVVAIVRDRYADFGPTLRTRTCPNCTKTADSTPCCRA